MIDGAFEKEPARGQTGVAGSDDDSGDGFDDSAPDQPQPQTTATVTFVGLVRTSYTADRFCDCATMASISFFGASASM